MYVYTYIHMHIQYTFFALTLEKLRRVYMHIQIRLHMSKYISIHIYIGTGRKLPRVKTKARKKCCLHSSHMCKPWQPWHFLWFGMSFFSSCFEGCWTLQRGFRAVSVQRHGFAVYPQVCVFVGFWARRTFWTADVKHPNEPAVTNPWPLAIKENPSFRVSDFKFHYWLQDTFESLGKHWRIRIEIGQDLSISLPHLHRINFVEFVYRS